MADEKIERLKILLAEEKYKEAAALLPFIKTSKAKTSSDFIALGKIYSLTGNFEKGMKHYNKAYKLRPSKLLYRDIVEMCLNCDQLKDAEEYFLDYQKLVPEDTLGILELKYRIEKKKKVGASALVRILKDITAIHFSEKYGYELAKQYYKLGLGEECKAVCFDLLDRFPESKEAQKAGKLLKYYNGDVTASDIKQEAIEVFKMVGGVQPDTSEGIEQGGHMLGEEVSKTTNEAEAGMPVTDEPQPEEADALPPIQENTQGLSDDTGTLNEEEADALFATIRAIAGIVEPEEEALRDIASDVSSLMDEREEKQWGDEAPEETFAQPDNEQEEPDEVLSPCEEAFRKELDACRYERNYPAYELYAPRNDAMLDDLQGSRINAVLIKQKVDPEEICKNFFRIDDVRRSIIRAIEMVMAEKACHFIVVTGEEKSGKSLLSRRLIRLMYKMGILRSDRIAKISAEKLNMINLRERQQDLINCNLLIENAASMTYESLKSVMELSLLDDNGTCIILEDDSKRINNLLRVSRDNNLAFNNRIHLPKYSVDNLLGFAYDIFTESDYGIEVNAMNTFREKIGEKTLVGNRRLEQTLNDAHTTVENADRRLAPLILKMAADAAYERVNNLVILEEDLIR